MGLRIKSLSLWYLLLILLAAECALYLAAGWAAGQARLAAGRHFSAMASPWREVDKVPYADLINRFARQEGVNATVVASIIQAESSFNPRAVSRTGAAGLMQVIPGTWRAVNSRIKACDGRHAGECDEKCYFDPEINIRIGTAYFAELARQYQGNLVLALAAYNAGPGAVDRWGGVPPYAETQGYVERVMAYWYNYSRLPAPLSGLMARRLEEGRSVLGWLAAVTAALAGLTAGRLLRRYRSWRWR